MFLNSKLFPVSGPYLYHNEYNPIYIRASETFFGVDKDKLFAYKNEDNEKTLIKIIQTDKTHIIELLKHSAYKWEVWIDTDLYYELELDEKRSRKIKLDDNYVLKAIIDNNEINYTFKHYKAPNPKLFVYNKQSSNEELTKTKEIEISTGLQEHDFSKQGTF